MVNNSAQQSQPTQNIDKPEAYSSPNLPGNSKTIIAVVVIVSFLLIGGVGGYILGSRKNQPAQQVTTSSPTITQPPPQDQDADEDVEGRIYTSEDPKLCSTIKFACILGYQPFYDESGCGCEPISGTGPTAN